MAKKKTKQVDKKPDNTTEPKYSFDEIYKSVVHLLTEGTKEQQAKVWKQLNEGEGDWVWLKMKVITDAYSHADAKGKEEFSMIGIQDHLKSGYVTQIEDFIDEETGIKYRQFKRKNGLMWRIPFATEGMDKYTYDKALNKKFLGDFIEMQTAGGDTLTLIPLDTPEKVKDQNNGGRYYQNHPLYKDTKPIVLVRKTDPDKNDNQEKEVANPL